MCLFKADEEFALVKVVQEEIKEGDQVVCGRGGGGVHVTELLGVNTGYESLIGPIGGKDFIQ